MGEGSEGSVGQRGWVVGRDKVAKVENVFKGGTQKVNSYRVVVALNTKRPDERNTNATSKGVADFGLKQEAFSLS